MRHFSSRAHLASAVLFAQLSTLLLVQPALDGPPAGVPAPTR